MNLKEFIHTPEYHYFFYPLFFYFFLTCDKHDETIQIVQGIA